MGQSLKCKKLRTAVSHGLFDPGSPWHNGLKEIAVTDPSPQQVDLNRETQSIHGACWLLLVSESCGGRLATKKLGCLRYSI